MLDDKLEKEYLNVGINFFRFKEEGLVDIGKIKEIGIKEF